MCNCLVDQVSFPQLPALCRPPGEQQSLITKLVTQMARTQYQPKQIFTQVARMHYTGAFEHYDSVLAVRAHTSPLRPYALLSIAARSGASHYARGD
jgi:hypothetical protein